MSALNFIWISNTKSYIPEPQIRFHTQGLNLEGDANGNQIHQSITCFQEGIKVHIWKICLMFLTPQEQSRFISGFQLLEQTNWSPIDIDAIGHKWRNIWGLDSERIHEIIGKVEAQPFMIHVPCFPEGTVQNALQEFCWDVKLLLKSENF